MKKSVILLLFIFLILSYNSNAQITITAADIATPGKVTYQANDTMPVISVGPAGANQVWNFSGVLNAHTIDTLLFSPLADAANYIDFPSTNLVIPINGQGDLLYAINDVANLSVVAATQNKILYIGGEKTTIVKANTPSEKMIEFPSTYNTYFTESYKNFSQYYYGSVPPNFATSTNFNKNFHRCGYSDSLREKTTVYKTVLVDSWGTLTTAAGTFDVLRLKETKVSVDTIEARDALLFAWFLNKVKKDSIVTYYWYANDMGVPLVTAVTDSVGAVKKATWLAAALGTTGISEMSTSSNIVVFPNPAQNQITFKLDASKSNSIIIYDITGRLIDSSPASSDQVTINTSNYSNGLYTYSLFDKKKNVVNRGKFSVVR